MTTINATEDKDLLINHGEDHLEEQELFDLSKFSKSELCQLLLDTKPEGNLSKASAMLKNIKTQFELLVDSEKETALQKFINEGGEAGDFELKKDDTQIKFEKAAEQLRERIHTFYTNAEKEKEKNLVEKRSLLEQLRTLISAEETNNSIIVLKEIQDKWKKTGAVPNAFNQELWQNYTALVDRFYNNRSIYFELKELDRKKNLESKIELCEKAEKLAGLDSINQAIKELKTLHDEYKNIGPVPKEQQEELWQRFKAASDTIYEKRNAHLQNIKDQQQENFKQKEALVNKITDFTLFKSERIDDWKAKTNELLALQEEWKKIGNVPLELSKDISKKFWNAGKAYFQNKEIFFNELEKKKEGNLAQKIALCEKAEALKDSDDIAGTTNTIKDLQKQWEKIGQVPLKQKEVIFKRFKDACDAFFQRKRELNAEVERQYEDNLKQKLAICEQITQLATNNTLDEALLSDLQQQFNTIGFVPKDAVKTIQDSYNNAINTFIKAIETTEGGKANENFKLSLEMAALKNTPDAAKKIQKKESDLVKQITTLKSEINTYTTNMDFLGRSNNAAKLKAEIQQRIDDAAVEVKKLEAQLKIVKQS